MTIQTGNFAELLWPGILDTYGLTYKDYPSLYPRVFKIMRATKRFEKIQGVTGLPIASIKPEAGTINRADPLQGFQKEFVMVEYGLATSITRQMVRDEQYNYIREVPGMLARSMRIAEEQTCWNIYNRATNASYTGSDGVTLVNTAHPLVGGGTFSNQISTAADLNQTSLESILADIMGAVDDMGFPISLMPKALIIHQSNNFRARKLLESAYVTGSADNDVNPLPGIVSDLVVSPYITDTDSFALTTNPTYGLVFMRREDSEIDRDNEFDTKNLVISNTARWDVGWVDPRGFYYSAGV